MLRKDDRSSVISLRLVQVIGWNSRMLHKVV